MPRVRLVVPGLFLLNTGYRRRSGPRNSQSEINRTLQEILRRTLAKLPLPPKSLRFSLTKGENKKRNLGSGAEHSTRATGKDRPVRNIRQGQIWAEFTRKAEKTIVKGRILYQKRRGKSEGPVKVKGTSRLCLYKTSRGATAIVWPLNIQKGDSKSITNKRIRRTSYSSVNQSNMGNSRREAQGSLSTRGPVIPVGISAMGRGAS